jgi:hypothetical protein
MRLRTFGYCGLFLSLVAACSSSGLESPSTAPALTQTKVESVDVAADASAAPAPQTKLLATAPGSVCTVPGSATAADAPAFYADDYGLLSISYMRAKPGSDRLVLNCIAPSGQQKTIDIESAPAAVRHSLTDPLAPGHKLRPALTGDPLSYTPQQLAAGGYPPRPDSVKSPKRHATWLKSVSRTLEYVPPTALARTEKPFTNLAIRTIWSGGAFAPVSNPFVEVEGSFSVPTVTPFTGTCSVPCITGSGGIWSGIDSAANDLIQAGVQFDSWLVGSYAFASYLAFTEALPGSPQLLNWSVGAGDEFFDLMWIGDSAGNLNIDSGTAWFEPVDYTLNTWTLVSASLSATPSGSQAEWIVEDHAGLLPNYGTATFNDTFVGDTAENEFDFLNSSSPTEIWMINNNDLLSIASINSNGFGVNSVWLASH